MVNSSSQNTLDGIALIGFRLQTNSVNPDLFTLMAYGERDFPVQDGAEIIFFTDPGSAGRACRYWPEDIGQLANDTFNLALVCDVVRSVEIIESENQDDSSCLLNCLNTGFDLVAASGHQWPIEYERTLSRLADHLTFEPEFVSFLEKENVTRKAVLNAFLWSIGSIVARAKLLI